MLLIKVNCGYSRVFVTFTKLHVNEQFLKSFVNLDQFRDYFVNYIILEQSGKMFYMYVCRYGYVDLHVLRFLRFTSVS